MTWTIGALVFVSLAGVTAVSLALGESGTSTGAEAGVPAEAADTSESAGATNAAHGGPLSEREPL